MARLPRLVGRRRSDECRQMVIAVVTAFASMALVVVVTLLMAFIEYQGRLASFQPTIQSQDIIDRAETLDQLDEALRTYKQLREAFDVALRGRLDAQREIGARTNRVCSRYNSQLQFECWNFLRSVPFEGTLGIGSPTAGMQKPTPDGERSPESPDFARTVLKNFVAHMKAATHGNVENTTSDALRDEDMEYVGYLAPDIIEIARLNHRLITELILKYEAAHARALSLCVQAVSLASRIKDKRGTEMGCAALNSVEIAFGQAENSPGDTPSTCKDAAPANPASANSPTASLILSGQGAAGLPPSAPTSEADLRLMDEQRRFDLVNQFRNYNLISSGIAGFLLMSPPDYLAAWLLVFGGAMGAMLKILFWHLMPARTLKWSDLFIEPAQGMVCAVILFILFRSGLVVISGGPTAEVSTLSPFFVAFVAIGAGLMSDQVIVAARRAAGGLIGGGSSQSTPRWAVGLAARLASADSSGIEVQELAERLQVPAERIVAWSELRKPVEGDYQEKIALVLGAPLHLLFTDVNPNVEVVNQQAGGPDTSLPSDAAPVGTS